MVSLDRFETFRAVVDCGSLNKVLVIEVNDNPNIDAGVEDGQLGDELYRRILQAFVQRLELKHRGQLSKALR